LPAGALVEVQNMVLEALERYMDAGLTREAQLANKLIALLDRMLEGSEC
jgi:hypothetical protein